jgi:TetR/AcrR family transcriptional regulator, tetracycline repressor protein
MATVERLRLTRERVVAEALDLVDHHGVEALTMRRLGSCLGVEAMSLYNHVSSKDDLLEAVASRLLELVEVPDPPEADWRAQLRAIASNVRAVGLRHPRVFPLVVSRRHVTRASWEPLVGGFVATRRAGLDARTSAQVVQTFVGFLVGAVLLDISAHDDPRRDPGAVLEAVPADEVQLREYLAARTSSTDDERFAASLDLLVAGIEHLIERA